MQSFSQLLLPLTIKDDVPVNKALSFRKNYGAREIVIPLNNFNS